MKLRVSELANINRGKPYEDRVCICCKGKPKTLSNYCATCHGLLKKELLDYVSRQ